jgi:hypothetical protein
MKYIELNVSLAVKRLMLDFGYTNKMMCDDLKVSKGTVCAWRTKRLAALSKVEVICALFDVPVSYFMQLAEGGS